MLPTLLYQLQLTWPETRGYIEDEIRKNPGVFAGSRAHQMETLFLPSITRFSLRRLIRNLMGNNTWLIVVDGLDECQGTDVQCDILRIVADAASKLSLPIRFLIASRPEAHIQRIFDGPSFKDLDLHRINLDHDLDAATDIGKFIKDRIALIHQHHPLHSHSTMPRSHGAAAGCSSGGPAITRTRNHRLATSTTNSLPALRLLPQQ